LQAAKNHGLREVDSLKRRSVPQIAGKFRFNALTIQRFNEDVTNDCSASR
jgi:hypothetical protein